MLLAAVWPDTVEQAAPLVLFSETAQEVSAACCKDMLHRRYNFSCGAC